MRRAYKHLVLVALVSLFVGLGMTGSYQESSLAQTAAPQAQHNLHPYRRHAQR